MEAIPGPRCTQTNAAPASSPDKAPAGIRPDLDRSFETSHSPSTNEVGIKNLLTIVKI